MRIIFIFGTLYFVYGRKEWALSFSTYHFKDCLHKYFLKLWYEVQHGMVNIKIECMNSSKSECSTFVENMISIRFNWRCSLEMMMSEQAS